MLKIFHFVSEFFILVYVVILVMTPVMSELPTPFVGTRPGSLSLTPPALRWWEANSV